MGWRTNEEADDDDWSRDEFAGDADITDADGDEAEDDGGVACPACGAAMYEDAPQCPACGIYPSREQFSDAPKPRWVMAGVALCLLIALTWLLLPG
jgi:hypothetical protein